MRFRNLYYGVNYKVIHVDDDVKRLGWKARLIYASFVLGSTWWAENYREKAIRQRVKRANLAGHHEGFMDGIAEGVEIGKTAATDPLFTGKIIHPNKHQTLIFSDDELRIIENYIGYHSDLLSGPAAISAENDTAPIEHKIREYLAS